MPLLVLLALCFLALPVHAKYGGGSGTAQSPYLIYTAEQMNAIGANRSDWNKQFKLMADIDLSAYTGTSFNIIGDYGEEIWEDRKTFTGVFDGNGHTISNFTYTTSEKSFTGIFGWAQAPARIEALGLIDPNVDAGWWTGSLVGELGWSRGTIGTITNCYVEGGSVSGTTHVGGLVGSLDGTITNCYATGSVSGREYVGGLVGHQGEIGTITNCYATGSVSGLGNDEFFGGLVGGNGGTITNCYATASVEGEDSVGGLVGSNSYYLYAGTITNCYSMGSVSGTTHVGGLVGADDPWGLGEVTFSFWDIQTSGQLISAGGTGKTTAEMQMESTFTDVGWDFWNLWSICEGMNYPVFLWQIPVGDFVCPDGITIEDILFFIEHWRDDNCAPSNDYCQGTDLDFSGTVDEADLEILVENWLAGGND